MAHDNDALALDYSQVSFPHETHFMDGAQRVRLLGCMSDRVYGISYYVERDGSESLGQVLDWQLNGQFGRDNSHPSMALIPPPAAVAKTLRDLNERLDAARSRLAANPDAPAEYRAVDERTISACEHQIAKLTPPAPVVVLAEAA